MSPSTVTPVVQVGLERAPPDGKRPPITATVLGGTSEAFLAASAPRRGVAQMPCQHPGGAGPTWQHLERAAGCEVGAGTAAAANKVHQSIMRDAPGSRAHSGLRGHGTLPGRRHSAAADNFTLKVAAPAKSAPLYCQSSLGYIWEANFKLSSSLGLVIRLTNLSRGFMYILPLLGLEHGTPFGTMGKGRGRCENGASLHVVVCEKLH